MQSKDKKTFSDVLTAIALACGKEINEKTYEVYFQALNDLSLADVELAGVKLLQTWDKPGMLPTPGQFREAVFGDPGSRATVALETVKRAMSLSGAYKSVCFTDDALMVAVENHGGWPEVCKAYTDLRVKDVSYWEHEFKQVYQQALKAGRKPQSRHLPGICESHNSVNLPSFERGKLPPQEIEVYGLGEKPKRLLLSEFKQKALIASVCSGGVEGHAVC